MSNQKEGSTIESSNYNVPAIFTIFGVTGDLASKKIIPSFWHLRKEQRLPKQLVVIGLALDHLSDADFKQVIRKGVMNAAKTEIVEEEFEEFFRMFIYQAGSFETNEVYVFLDTRIRETERSWGLCASKLFYLAVPPSAYEMIFEHLASVKLNVPCGGDLGWSRILIEKPFGHDLTSASELQKLLSRFFKEEQVYRIDHYLFKEIVQGIQNFRFSNNLLETTWSATNIERIDVRLHESIGVESRGQFYDGVGALQDVGQNHLLMMLAVITMEYPFGMDSLSIRQNRAAVLSTLAPWTDETLRTQTYRAQYEGYRDIEHVRPDSQTETYFAFKTELRHARWAGVPIYVESGKRMGESRKEIVLTFKYPNVCLSCSVNLPHSLNRISFRLEPNDEIVINFWTKKPGFEQVLEERSMSFFLYEKKNKVQYVEEYAKVIHAAIVGEQSFFTSSSEVEILWKFIDPIVTGWARGLVPLDMYKPDTTPRPVLLGKETRTIVTLLDKGTIGFVGLGKMGANLARQVHSKGWSVVGFNQSQDATKELESEGIVGTYSLQDFIRALPAPRTIWLMVPYGAVDSVIDELTPMLEKGDTIIDGGNSPYKDSIRRHQALSAHGINFLDVGVSGGPQGAKDGACIMVGGERAVYKKNEQLFSDMSVPDGYAYAGGPGAGHFVKMIHNGIEYGMMQSIAEGFAILKQSPLKIQLAEIAELYSHGSVIESRLISWLTDAYKKYGVDLNVDECCAPTVAFSGEGQWTVEGARDLGVPASIIEGALEFRKQSHLLPSYTGRVLSALRHQFGGHDATQK